MAARQVALFRIQRWVAIVQQRVDEIDSGQARGFVQNIAVCGVRNDAGEVSLDLVGPQVRRICSKKRTADVKHEFDGNLAIGDLILAEPLLEGVCDRRDETRLQRGDLRCETSEL